MYNKVFLRGVDADNISKQLSIPYFIPSVEDDFKKLEYQKTVCTIHCYFISSVAENSYLLAEAMDSVHSIGNKTIVYINPVGFPNDILEIANLIKSRGGTIFIQPTYEYAIEHINKKYGVLQGI